MAFSFQPKTVTDGMIFCVDAANTKSYPGSGTNVTNIGKTTSTASLVNGVAYNSSQGGSFFFDGSNDYISCGDDNFRISSNTLSAEVVFYHDGTDKTNMPVFAKRQSVAPFIQWQFVINNGNPYAGGTGKVVTAFFRPDDTTNSGPPDPKDRTATYTLPSAGIYYVTLVNDSTSLRLFVNGTLQNTATSAQVPGTFLVSEYELRLGNLYTANYFTGSIYTARLYNRALTNAEVLQNYNALKGRFGLT